MRTIYAEYNINHDSIDVYTNADICFALIVGKLKNLKPHMDQNVRLLGGRGWALEYVRLYLDGNSTDVGGCRRFTWIIDNLNKKFISDFRLSISNTLLSSILRNIEKR